MADLVAEEGSLAGFVWRFEPAAGTPSDPSAPTSAASLALSKALKTRGWKFVGPTTMHAFLQSMGVINDHAEGCAVRDRALAARAAFMPPA